jgi:hypothetical protein
MQDESVPVLTPKFLPCEVSDRPQHFVWRGARRHREHEFMGELRRLSTLRSGEGWLAPDVVDVEIPVIQEIFPYPQFFTKSSRCNIYNTGCLPTPELSFIKPVLGRFANGTGDAGALSRLSRSRALMSLQKIDC